MRLFYILICCLFVLTACTSQKEKMTTELLSKEQGYYEIYIVYSDANQRGSSSLEETVNSIISNHIEKVGTVSFMNSNTDIKKAFDISEYPTILVFDTEKLVLQTMKPDFLEELLSK